MLKSIPPGVFINCKVLRKEILNLNKNLLTSLICIGNKNLSDLSLLKTVNIRGNLLKTLPNEIDQLTNLRELLVGANELSELPNSINTLQYLEHLDVSENQLTSNSLDVIKFMSSLRILNITGNKNIKRLPKSLATCDNLYDLVLDAEYFEWPKLKILRTNTSVILQYLLTGDFITNDSSNDGKEILNYLDVKQEAIEMKRDTKLGNSSEMQHQNDDMLIILKKQQDQKQQFLKDVLLEQCKADKTVIKIQQLKDNERNKLIKDILTADNIARLMIKKFLALKTTEDSALKEKEKNEEEKLLETLNLKHSDLRKQEILKLISQSLVDEEKKISSYNNFRDKNAKQILHTDDLMTLKLSKVYTSYQENKAKTITQICDDEELQKRAVSELIAINDSRSWSLISQLDIVERKLAEMTVMELKRKQKLSEAQINDFTEKRMQLTDILMNLLDQQESRRKELLVTLRAIESQRTKDQDDFWLMQYQRLLDSQPLEYSSKMTTIDPGLGYYFLCNGVINSLPFLQKLFQNEKLLIEDIKEQDLIDVGIKSEINRINILKSIKDFNSGTENLFAPTRNSKNIQEATEALEVSEESHVSPPSLSECVVCMEEIISTIFIPCGHFCCCEKCQTSMNFCPICREQIQRRVKIFRS